MEFIQCVAQYVDKVVQTVEPIVAVIISAIVYLIFPDTAFMQAALAVAITMILDIITKYIQIGKTSGLGIWGAIKAGKIRSARLWEGTYKKVVTYFIVMILAGLSVKVIPVNLLAQFPPMLIYTLMWLREVQSVLENLMDAGYEVGWLLSFLKKRSEKITDTVNKLTTNNK